MLKIFILLRLLPKFFNVIPVLTRNPDLSKPLDSGVRRHDGYAGIIQKPLLEKE
jgi:hypothetical protein